MFRPYRNAAKLSENRARLSCINCKCMKFASRSAMPSESSPNASVKECNGVDIGPDCPFCDCVCDARSEPRDGGRNGVVGRDGIGF